ncbi:MAG TPA: MraY family glycosyltransferase [Acidimicrobiales bacterium]|nr:MraY family glycosyltransferase [Acidimicrobiales bacterium]
MSGYLVVLLVSIGVTVAVTPGVRWLALRLRVVQAPDERRIHTKPTPVLGGLSLYLGFVAGFATASQLDQFDPVFTGTSEPIGVFVGATLTFLLGLLDDVRELSPPAKMSGQVLAASLMSLLGVTMLFFRLPFLGNWALSPDLAPLVTVLWVLGMATAINYIDGLDGLAAGITAIAAGSFALYSDRLFDQGLLPNASNSVSPLLAVIVVGICVGFLPWNFHPARIFMGDSGALLLGVLMAASTLLVGGQTAASTSGTTFFFFAPLLIPLVILGVPIFDVVFSSVRRARRRDSVVDADPKDHLHARLLLLGHGHRRAVLILWAWTAILSGLVLWPVYSDMSTGWLPFALAAMAVGLYTVLHPEVRRRREADQLELDLTDRGSSR